MLRKQKTRFYCAVIIAVWIIVLALPSLRTLFLAQTFLGSDVLPAAIVRPKPDFAELAYRHPKNLSLQLMALTAAQPVLDTDAPGISEEDNLNIYISQRDNYKRQLTNQYRTLMTRFPDSPILLVHYLNSLSNWMWPIRLGGRMADPDANENIKKGIPSPERTGQRNYTPQQWQDAIKFCREGQRIAPRNAYFDVVEAYWQFAEFHDAAAWAAIERAVKKPDFSLYKIQINQQMLRSYEMAFGRPLTWEEIEYDIFGIFSDAPNDFAIQIRQLTRWMTWEGTKAQLHGDNATALKRYDLTFRITHLWQQNAASLLDFMTATAAESIALYGPEYAGTKPTPHTVQEEVHLSAFKNYTMTQHRPDLAHYTYIAKTDHADEFTIANFKRLYHQYGNLALAGFVFWRANVLLLLLLVGSALAWLFVMLALKVLFRNDTKNSTDFSSSEYWRGALSFIAWPAVVILIPRYTYSFFHYMQNPYGRTYQDVATMPILSGFGLSPWWIILCGIITPIIFGVSYLLRRAAWLNRPAGEPTVLLWKRFIIAIASFFFVILWTVFASGKWLFAPYVGYIAYQRHLEQSLIGAITGTGTTGAVSSWEAAATIAGYIVMIGLIIGLSLGLIIGLIIIIGQWRKVENRSAARADFLNLLHGSTLRWLALGSVLYLVILAASIPVRQPIDKHTLQEINQGEKATLKAGR